MQRLAQRLATFADPRQFLCLAQGIAQRLGDFDELEQRVVVGLKWPYSCPPRVSGGPVISHSAVARRDLMALR